MIEEVINHEFLKNRIQKNNYYVSIVYTKLSLMSKNNNIYQ